ncbi:thioredoxin-dependent thiol peroxidase [Microbacterium sp. NEAU-LLC]|uniref:thioredoxin-dependent peroxiredoxin n=1 Tax=Microbacterium helvum TaxID=2773713 RepID=A0ABR8NT97_9MICO|nr:thioredoxin-dependent thiol peroxidase [Microbacterium helvum]MBD3942786.1 thioredoxin-dependent thiol peroxidase [Microbacterium helvum]
MTDGIHLSAGDANPGFALSDATGAVVRPEDFAGRRLVVYFYPAAFTPGCTTEACDFRDNLASLQAAGVAVVGISPDTVERLAEWAEAEQLSFPLLSDADHAVAEAWGAWGTKVVNGEERVGLIRSTFVLAADGTVESAEYHVDPNGHVARLREQLAA